MTTNESISRTCLVCKSLAKCREKPAEAARAEKARLEKLDAGNPDEDEDEAHE